MNHYEQYIGQVFDGRYRIDALLGVGGMAAVMAAHDIKEGKNVAVKILKEEMSNDKQAVKRFINESKAVAVMNHPNIVKVYDVVVGDDLKYIVMEYIEGETLRKYMDRIGPIPFDKTVAILSQILDALDHAHGKGVIHRDIKPQNILIMKSGKVVVTDFGIAKIADGDTMMDDKTMGTVYYISPEQAEGRAIDNRSDLYSLGAMLFEMLTGRFLFDADSTLGIAMKQINAEPPSLRDILPTVPKGMEQFVLFALMKDPEDRFQSAAQMMKYLEVLKNDPFAEFALTPREEHRIALEEEEKAKKLQKKENSAKKSGKDSIQNKDETSEVRYVRGDSWSPLPVMIGIVLAFIVVLTVSGYYAVVNIFWDSDLNVFKDKSGENVTIENYVGTVFTEANRAYLIEDMGYHKVTIVEEYSDTVEKGVVISQDPSEGEVRKLSSVELTVVVSKGSDAVENVFPDYSMQDYRQVRLILEEKGYEVILVPVSSSAADSCLILKTEPAAGEHLPQDGKVTLYYSAGLNAQDVIYNFPNFVGMSEMSVKYYVETYKLNLVSVRYVYSDTVEAGRVISCSINPGPKPRLTPLSVVISLGMDPDKIPPEPPTPDVDTDPLSDFWQGSLTPYSDS